MLTEHDILLWISISNFLNRDRHFPFIFFFGINYCSQSVNSHEISLVTSISNISSSRSGVVSSKVPKLY